MSRKDEFLSQERRTRALAERFHDALIRNALMQAADAWRLLADLECDDPPTRWAAGVRRSAGFGAVCPACGAILLPHTGDHVAFPTLQTAPSW